MVFESIVVELINRYLGAFVENLDTSQLQIGLWGGDVVLSNLNLKESALDELDLPVKIKAGHIGKLTLKIPWKNLYTEAVVAQIEGIYALAVPNVGIKYNEAKEKKALQDAKLALLASIEEKKKLEAEKDKPKNPKNDSFVEKLATQVIKNLQIKVSMIHIRYEDKYSNPARPVALGITLQELLFQTTDGNWKETIIKEAVTQIFKLVRLDSLAVYWNSKDKLLQDSDKKIILSTLQENIPKHGIKPVLQYLFKPISAVAHLRLNTKPELTDFSLPKIFLTLVFDEIAVALSKDQYDDILEMLEALERMDLMARYRKTRPDTVYKGHAREWWKHAYAVILEHTIQRRRNMWNWNLMKRHRAFVKQYKELYILKLDNQKLNAKQQEQLKICEEELDVWNITMCRNQADMCAVKLGKQRAQEKSEAPGWFGGWFGGGKKQKPKKKTDGGGETDLEEIGTKFQEEFTSDEKSKLYKAIGYDENAKDPTFPIEYVAVRLVTKLNKLSVTLVDNRKAALQHSQLLKLSLTEICASFGQRPAANAIRLDAKVERLRVTGSPRKEYTPRMVTSVGVSKEENASLLTLTFETNPPDGLCDSRVRVHFRPLEIIYDAITVNGMSTFFVPPESVRLKQLSNAAMAKYDDIKSQTAAGVMFMVEQRKYTDIDVHLMPSYIIVPETGELKKDVSMMLLNLGQLKINSEKNKELPQTAKSQLTPEELTNYAYEKFNINLENVQLLFVQPGDSWQDEMALPMSKLFILRPLTLRLLLEKCIFPNDATLPTIRVSAELPLVAVNISDQKLVNIMNLVNSIPMPEPGPEVKESSHIAFEDEGISSGAAGKLSMDVSLSSLRSANTTATESDFVNQTQFAMSFVLNEISVEIMENVTDGEVPFLKLVVKEIGLSLKGRTFDMSADGFLGGIYLQHMQYKVSQGIRDQLKKCEVVTGELINIINTPFQDENEPLLSIHYLQADKKGPEFKTTYNNTAQSITVEFSTLDLVLHQGVILSLMEFAQKLQPVEDPKRISTTTEWKVRRPSTASITPSLKIASSTTAGGGRAQVSDVQLLRFSAIIESIQLSLVNETSVVMHTKVEGIEVGARMHTGKLGVSALMRKIQLLDPDPKTKYPKIFSVSGTEMLKFEMIQYNNGTQGSNFDNINCYDMDIFLQLGRARIVFVNKFILSLLNFLDNFSVAKTKLDEASKAVKEASKDVAKNLQESAPRIKLDVALKAPILVVPKSSRSLEVMMINLGDINVGNRFERIDLDQKLSAGHAHIVEHMTVMLTNLTLSRGVLINEEGLINWEITILDPMTFKVNIQRNLSTGWFHGVPDVEVTGYLDQINVKLNKEDLILAFNILSGNLKERNKDDPIVSKESVRTESMTKKSDSVKSVTVLSTAPSERGQLSLVAEEIYSTLKMNFKLMYINVQLFRGRVNLASGETIRPVNKMLSQLTLKMLSVNLNMKSDESLSAKVGLVDFTMDDCRVEKEGGITKLIRRTAYKHQERETPTTNFTASTEGMFIDLAYDQSAKQDKKVLLNICSLHICICLEFIMKVMDFFYNSIPYGTPTAKDPRLANKPPEKKPDSVPTPKQEEMIGSIDLVIQLEKPEIYMIEDQMNPHTDSLIVDVQLDFRLRMNQDTISIKGAVKELSIVSCIFDMVDTKQSALYKKARVITSLEKKLLEVCYSYYEHTWERLPYLIYVLHPVNIDIVGNSPQGRDHHIDVVVSDFIVTISPPTIRLITSILAGMAVISPDDNGPVVAKDYSSVWEVKTLDHASFWYTHSVEGTSVDLVAVKSSSSMSEDEAADLLLVSIPVIVFRLEGGIGHRTVPLLMVESSISSQIHNWTSDLFFESTFGIEIAYNNEKIGVWEPILEPVMEKYVPHKWELAIEMIKTEEMYREDDDASILPPPKLTINITSSEPMQLIVTKTCLDVLSNLGQAFSEAYNLREMEGTLGQKILPFVFKNQTGKVLSLKLDANFEVHQDGKNINVDSIPNAASVSAEFKPSKAICNNVSIIRATQQQEEKRITFQLEGQNRRHEISIKQAIKRYFTLNTVEMVVSVEAKVGQKIVTFMSPLRVQNHHGCPIELFYKDKDGIQTCGIADPDSTLEIPMDAVYSPTGDIYFLPQPDGPRYDISKETICWKSLTSEANGKVRQICCLCSKEDNPSFFFNVRAQFEQIYEENTENLTKHLITLHLEPTVILHNLLPMDVQYTLENFEDIEKHTPRKVCFALPENPVVYSLAAGHHEFLVHASVNQTNLELQIPGYRDLFWKGKKVIRQGVPELSVWTLEADDHGQTVYMELGVHCKEKNGIFDMSVYCPYWVINLSNRMLALKEDDKEQPMVQPAEDTSIMLFYFRDKPMFGSSKRKVMLRLDDSEWSDKFSLDTVGTGGNVSCKHKAGGYVLEVGLSIKLSASGLTKIITFTPFYLLLNAASVPLCVKESEFAEETTIQPEECKYYYPKMTGKEMKIQVRAHDSNSFTCPFYLNKAHSTLLKLADKYGGIQAECQVSESSMITTFKTFRKGMATVQLINHTSQCVVHIRQSGSKDVEIELKPQTAMLYTWSNPTGIREILWSCGNKKDGKNTLVQDHIEEFFAANDVKVYFVTFLDGLQRVAMFTQDLALATVAQEAGELEQADQEINLKIHDMGFSLVNNEKLVELAYMGITSSGVIWEEKKKRFKAMTVKDNLALEHAYQKHLLELAVGKSKGSIVMLENKLEVDFDSMKLVRPRQTELRRSFEDGIWVQVRTSPHSMQFHAKINRLQFDNQLRHAVFPTVLSPLPPPKSVAAESVPKPFIEVSLMNRIHEHSNLVQIKYFKVLIQEMNLKVDQGFLNELLAMFASDANTLREQELNFFNDDVAVTKLTLTEVAGVSIQAQRVSFYDYFHISPIKIHVSFSLQGGSLSDSPQANIMGVFLQSVGVVLTDIQDVVFKLGYFERNHSFYNNTQLTSEFIRHYSGQAVKQMYVLVLGLDVLGNPFGLLRGLSEGIEDLFYEPYQGAIQGPQEFAEGLALGVRSLFGHAVGGAAGAVSRITGTLGKGLAALTLDDDYQKKRREQLNKRPATATEGFARGGKGLVMGVFDGVTGIVRKPVEGAKQEGVAGFFKGVGKGLVGVVTRPTSGVVDFASSSLEGIRRITDFSEEIHRLRPPRRFNKDGIVRPYIQEEAEGYNLLLETDKGKYVESDEYVTHVKTREDGKLVFIITDKRIMLAKRGEIFGSWDTEWMYTYQDLRGTPKLSPKGIEILLKEREKKKLFGSNVNKKDLHISDTKIAQAMLSKIVEIMEAERVESGV